MRRFGYHVSIAGGLATAIEEARVLTCNTIQIFLGPPHTWQLSQFTPEDVERFQKGREELDLQPIVVHAAYLPNPASGDKKLWKISVSYLIRLIQKAHELRLDGVHCHLGANPSRREGIRQVIEAFKAIRKELPKGIKVLPETDAGPGNHVGDNFEEIAELLAGVSHHPQFAVTLDTCHIFAAGYDIRTEAQVEATMRKFDKAIGLDRLYVVHANDSKGDLGSHLDRHEHIGEGRIGLAGFKALLHHPKLKNIPFVLETPQNGDLKEDLKNIQILRRLAD